jgi:hypothetical protein
LRLSFLGQPIAFEFDSKRSLVILTELRESRCPHQRILTSPQEKKSGRAVYTRKRHNINFVVPPRGTLPYCARASQPFTASPASTFCPRYPRLSTIQKFPWRFPIRGIGVICGEKKNANEPEKMAILPEDQRLKPENEPEKNLKFSFAEKNSVLSPLTSVLLRTFGHFQDFNPAPSKSPAISTMFRLLHFVTACYTKKFSRAVGSSGQAVQLSSPRRPGAKLFFSWTRIA